MNRFMKHRFPGFMNRFMEQDRSAFLPPVTDIVMNRFMKQRFPGFMNRFMKQDRSAFAET